MERRSSIVDRWSFVVFLALCLLHQASGQTIKWSECSRSCGGGVRHALNGCLQYGPDSECLSFNKSYVSCNTQPCPPGTPDFRTAQCEQYEKKPISGKFYKLEAYISATSGATCELYCRTKGDKFYLKFSETVRDGTPCGPNLSGICVENVCEPVGCDRELGSPKEFDKCMVCGGDGTTCKKHSKSFNLTAFRGAGYHKVMVLPKGSTSISIKNPDGVNRTFLALTTSDGEYLLNGYHKISSSRALEVHGVYFNYTRSPESLVVPGPTNQELVVMVLLTRPTDAQLTLELYLSQDESSNSASQSHLAESKVYGVDEEYDTDDQQAAFLRLTEESSYKLEASETSDRSHEPSGIDYVTFAEDLPQFRTNQYFAARGNAQWKHASGKSSGGLDTKVESGEMVESGNEEDDDEEEEESSSGETLESLQVSATEKSPILDLDNEKLESGKEEEEEGEDGGDDDEGGDLESSAASTSGVATSPAEVVTLPGEVSGLPTGIDEEDDEDGTGKEDEEEGEASGEAGVEEPESPATVGGDDDDDGDGDDDDGKGDDKDKDHDEDDDDDDDDKKVDAVDEGDDDDVDKKKGSGDDDKDGDEDEDGDDDDDDEVEKKVVSGDDDVTDEPKKSPVGVDDDDDDDGDDDDDDGSDKKEKEDHDDDDEDKKKEGEGDDDVVDKKASGDDKKATDVDIDEDDDDDDDEETEKKTSGLDDDDDVKKEDDDETDTDETTEKEVEKDDDDDDGDDEDDDDDGDDDDEDSLKVDEEKLDKKGSGDDDGDDDEVTTEKHVKDVDEDESGVVDKDDEEDDDDDDKVKKGSGDVITKETAKTTEVEKKDEDDDDDDDGDDYDDKSKVEEGDDDDDKDKDEDDDDDKDKDDDDDDADKDEDEDTVRKVTEKVVKEDLTATGAVKEDDDDEDDDGVKKSSGDDDDDDSGKKGEDDDDDYESGREASGEHVRLTTVSPPVVAVGGDDDDGDGEEEKLEVTAVGEAVVDDEDEVTTIKEDDDDDEDGDDDDDDSKKGSGEEAKEVTTSKDDDDEEDEKKEEDGVKEDVVTEATTAKSGDDDDDDDDDYDDGDDDDDEDKVTQSGDDYEDRHESTTVTKVDVDDDDGAGDYDDKEATTTASAVLVVTTTSAATTKEAKEEDDDETTTKGSGDGADDDEGGDDDDDEETTTAKQVEDEDKKVGTTEAEEDDDDDESTTKGSGDDEDDDEVSPGKGDDEHGEEVAEVVSTTTTAVEAETTTDDDDDDDDDDVTTVGSGGDVDGDEDATPTFGRDEDEEEEIEKKVEKLAGAGIEPTTSDADEVVTSHLDEVVEGRDDDDEDATAAGSGSGDDEYGSGTKRPDEEIPGVQEVSTSASVTEHSTAVHPTVEETTTHTVLTVKSDDDEEEEDKVTFLEVTTTRVPAEGPEETTEDTAVYPTVAATTVPPAESLTPHPITPPIKEGEEEEEEKVEEVTEGELQVTKAPHEPGHPFDDYLVDSEPTVAVTTCSGDEFSEYHEEIIKEKFTKWYVGAWGSCEEGKQRREVVCVVYDDEEKMTITQNQHRCPLPRPHALRRCRHEEDDATVMFIGETFVQSCYQELCKQYEWITSEWVGCSSSCEEEYDSRLVFCSEKQTSDHGLIVSEDHCRDLVKPDNRRECHRQEIACELKPKWFATEWGECSTKCGVGTQTRRVFCGKVLRQTVGDTILLTQEENCDQHTKVPHIRFCRRDCEVRWVSGPYGQCSASCGGGIRTRQVMCLKGHQPSDECDAHHKPFSSQECNYHACPYDIPELPCESSLYGCCPDGLTPAESFGPDRCRQADPHPPGPCTVSPFGCCPDGLTPAQGSEGQGCDEVRRVKTEGLEACVESDEGSGDVTCVVVPDTRVSCHETEFHCCPDGFTPASGPHFQGCPGLDCRHQEYGCCQDGVTPALGPQGQGCPEYIPPRAPIQTRPCAEHFYGCCKDGFTLAQGPEFEGCPEAGEAFHIDCSDTEYGCCLDQKSPASGPHHAGCPLEHRKKGICFLPSESGTCQNHTIMWYYDSLIGECSRFWYSGCGTNGNLFESEEDCTAVCINPPDHDKCFLPKVVGRCRASIPKFFYNVETQSCESFSYGGCGENGNNFDSQQTCDLQCTIPLTYNVCQLPSSRGPCQGNYPRWYYDHYTKQCQQFYYGGCLGNENRFETFEDCQMRCVGPIEDVCSLEPDSGPCTSVIPFWHFNSTTDTCERFYFGGCQGNLNRFTTKQKCLHTCLLPKKESHSICNLPHDFGLCSSYFDKWYFDQADGYCKKFVYSGCGGTLNRFDSEVECRSSCDAKEPVADDVCSLPWSTGPCTDYTIMYYYNKDHQACDRFYYGGCEGNANRYHTEDECLAQCGVTKYPEHVVPVEPSPETRTESTRETTTSSTLTASEICSLSYDVGPCSDYAIFYYFDAGSQSCNRFYYGGCEGNLNRYQTEEECLRQCTQTPDEPTVETGANTTSLTATEICSLSYDTGPCADYTILYYYSPEYQSCLRFYYGGCNGNGNRFNSEEECDSFCKPKPTFTTPTRCTLGAEHGPCQKNLARWHYDHETMVCRMFEYGGCDGNRNRFMTQESCLKSCHPDHHDERSVDYSAESQDVDREALRVTDEHVPKGGEELPGVTHSISEDELSQPHVPASSVCSQPSERGPCSEWEVQWYYDSAHENCLQFWYGGCEGNGNRFSSQEECEARCKEVVQPVSPPESYPESPSVHHHGREKEEEGEVVSRVDGTGQETYSAEHVCQLPSSTGPCSNYEIKWHYNPEHKDCVEFYYGGCEGNANRFETKEDCLSYCQPQAQDEVKLPIGEFCSLPLELGQCSGHELRYYWDPDKNQCRPFHYTGCNGNQNNFETVGHCYHHCGLNLKEEERYSRESCSQPRETGTCYDFEIRYYFDYEKNDCLGFYFGGCNGNSNNFHSYEDCRAICLPETSQHVCPPCDLHCAGQLRYDTDEYGCQRCYCVEQTQDHHHQQHHREQKELQVAIDTHKQLLPAFEYTTFVCRGHIEPGYSVMVERDGDLVAGTTAQDYGQVGVTFNATESGNYKCVVQTPSGQSFESTGYYVNVYHVFLNASFEDNQLVLSCEGFGLDQFASEAYSVFKKVDDDNRILMEEYKHQPSLVHKLHLSIEQDVDHSGKYVCELHSRHFNLTSNYALVTIRLHGSPDTDAYYHGEQSGGFTLPVHDHAVPSEFDAASGLYDNHHQQQLRQGLRVKLSVESRESEVMFKCAVSGASQNDNVQVRWERNNKEIYTVDERIPHDKVFHISISNSDLDDSGTYLCLIEHHGRQYASEPLNLQRVVPGQITLHAYKQLLDDGELLRVDCTAGVSTGTPITLQGNGQMLHPVSTSFILNGVRAEFQLTPQGSRNYKCVAHVNREVTLDSPTAWIPLKSEVKAKLVTDKSFYSAGDEVQLKCEVSGVDSYEKDFAISFKRFVPSTGDVLRHYGAFDRGHDVLRLDAVGEKDAGHYKCEVLFSDLGFRVSSNSVLLNVTRPVVQESSCVDMPNYADCNLVVRARFCNHQYFKKFCCRSCREAGLI